MFMFMVFWLTMESFSRTLVMTSLLSCYFRRQHLAGKEAFEIRLRKEVKLNLQLSKTQK